MEQNPPKWLTPEFLEKGFTLSDEYGGIHITKVTTLPAAPAGNNFGSIVLRVIIDYELKEERDHLSLIIKAPLTEGVLKDMIESFNSEPSFYYSFLPQAYKLLDDHFAPECFPSISPDVVILEDLKDKGFLMAEKTKQLDFEQCKLYMKAAASFHAVTFAMCQKNPELIKIYKGSTMFSNENKFGPVTKNVLKYGLKCAAAHFDSEKHSKVFLNSVDAMWDMLVNLQKPRDKLNCLRQGDPWIPNMLFKYDEDGNVCDIKLIDFQYLSYGSPIFDIVFFVWTSANANVRKSRLNDLYQFYLDNFNENLEKMGFNEKFHSEIFFEEIRKFGVLALWLFAIVPSVLNEDRTDFNLLFSKLDPKLGEPSTNPFDEYYIDSYCRNVLPQYVEHLELAGVFDYIENSIKQ